jgi:hypothetical protein
MMKVPGQCGLWSEDPVQVPGQWCGEAPHLSAYLPVHYERPKSEAPVWKGVAMSASRSRP